MIAGRDLLNDLIASGELNILDRKIVEAVKTDKIDPAFMQVMRPHPCRKVPWLSRGCVSGDIFLTWMCVSACSRVCVCDRVLAFFSSVCAGVYLSESIYIYESILYIYI